jgi:protein-S-isoprenylcysteine O-methyltransferase Ste14
MATALFMVAAATGIALVALLVLTLAVRSLRIWPTPGTGSWQGYVFWPLFRGLNLMCFAVALTDPGRVLGLPQWARLAVLGLLVGAVLLFRYAFRMLGRDNSYCAQDGLVTGGIYQWSRNPQNAMLMVVYACLAVAADGPRAYLVCALMIMAYGLMVLAEEPWLASIYGEPYRDYCRSVPRFFNWARLFTRGRKAASPGR